MPHMPTLQNVFQARDAIRGVATRTPLVIAGYPWRERCDIRFKLETVQPIGAFKIRGAANALSGLSADERTRGVVCASTGNHGRALAYAATRLGIGATVCMSELVPRNKVEAIRALGANVVITGNSQDDAQVEANRLTETEGYVQVPPFDHPDVIAGQGTIGLEIIEDFAAVDTIIVPLSGGGLISGIAMAAKSINPAICIVGVGIERCPAMQASLEAGRPIDVVENESLADSLGGGIGLSNRYTFEMTRRHVDEVIAVSEDQIARALKSLFMREGIVCEGAGAVGVIPFIEDIASLGKNIAVVISGRNVDMETFRRICA